MATVRAQQWAYFLKRLGFPESKSSIMREVECMDDQAVWNKYIAPNPCAIVACEESKVKGPEDVYWLFREMSYSGMRSTFPSRSNGRSIIGPRIVPMKKLPDEISWNNQYIARLMKESKTNEVKSASYVDPNKKQVEFQITASKELIGKRINHTVFGDGSIQSIDGKNLISVYFEQSGEKLLAYDICLENGYISFL